MKKKEDDLPSTSIIYTLFLNCLYLLFIFCSRQLCSGEMATNAGYRLATTGLLTRPSVSGLLSLAPLVFVSFYIQPVLFCSVCTMSLVVVEY